MGSHCCPDHGSSPITSQHTDQQSIGASHCCARQADTSGAKYFVLGAGKPVTAPLLRSAAGAAQEGMGAGRISWHLRTQRCTASPGAANGCRSRQKERKLLMDSEGVAAVLLGERKSCAPISSASTLRSANCCGHSSRAGRRAAATARDRGQLGQLGPRSFHPRLAAAGGGARLAALLCAPVNEHARGRVLSLPPSCNGGAPRSATARSRRKDSTPTAKKPRCPQQAEGRAPPFVRVSSGNPALPLPLSPPRSRRAETTAVPRELRSATARTAGGVLQSCGKRNTKRRRAARREREEHRELRGRRERPPPARLWANTAQLRPSARAPRRPPPR